MSISNNSNSNVTEKNSTLDANIIVSRDIKPTNISNTNVSQLSQ